MDIELVGKESGDNSDDEYDDDDEQIEKFLNRTMLQDIASALYEIRITGPLVALLGIFLAYHLTISPYQIDIVDGSVSQDFDLVTTLL
jgi:hypothetical protein